MLKLCLYLLSSLTILGSAIISPALGELNIHFAEANSTLVKLLLTAPALLVIPSSYYAISLSKRFGKRNVLVVALFIYAITGTMAGFVSNIYLMLFLRALLGIGMGLIMPIGQSLPADFFEGVEKNTVIARQGSSISLGSMICLMLSGYLATVSWRYAFFTHLVALPIIYLVICYIPKFTTNMKKQNTTSVNIAETNTKQVNQINQPSSSSIPFLAWLIILSIGFFTVGMFGYFANIAIILQSKNLGTAAIAGYILTFGSLTSFTISFALNNLREFFGKYVVLLIPVCACSAFLCIYFANNLPMLFLGAMLQSASVGIIMPTCAIALTNLVRHDQLVKAMAFYTISMFLGQFFSPIILEILPTFPSLDNSGASLVTVSALYAIVLIFLTPYVFLKKQ